ncbi:MAG: hypothetical protein JSU06_04615 [Actinobacteria bacterium]|nr:hypothetical protein [Actinomycetota bacterium]
MATGHEAVASGAAAFDAEEASIARTARAMLAPLIEEFLAFDLTEVPIDRMPYGERPDA